MSIPIYVISKIKGEKKSHLVVYSFNIRIYINKGINLHAYFLWV